VKSLRGKAIVATAGLAAWVAGAALLLAATALRRPATPAHRRTDLSAALYR